jgi:heptose I phosphotransferase
MGRTGAVTYGSLWDRWVRGVSWTWVNDQYRAHLPKDLASTVMTLQTRDRFHTKQGRSTARFVFDASRDLGPDQALAAGEGTALRANWPLAVYLKRHFNLPWSSRLAALFDPAGRHSPAAAEWAHLERVRAMGIDVPEVVAAGERIGPHVALCSFLMVAELRGCEPLHESLPKLAQRLDGRSFIRLKRRLTAEMARITATLHASRVFHKDLYLCHFFLDMEQPGQDGHPSRVILIDFHRLREHWLWPDWWRWKDLGQLLFSTYGVSGIDDRDRWRFWSRYRRLLGIPRSRSHAWMVRLRAARYRAHNRKRR